jgi:hypothetical protein
VIAAGLLLTACDQSFEPLGENPSVFSMFGVLNASADTQWVRVTPIRESVGNAPSSIDATVTLEHLESGAVVELRDSIFEYAGDDPDVVAPLYAHNFWTTEPILPGGTYTIRATRSDGSSSFGTVKVPVSVSRVVLAIAPHPLTAQDNLRLESDGHVAILQVLHQEEQIIERQGLTRLTRTAGGLSRVNIHRAFLPVDPQLPPPPPAPPPLPRICTQDRICAVRMFISALPWPFNELAPDEVATHTEGISNIEGGTGFIGAVITHTVPYEACVLSPSRGDPCELVYDGSTATLVGTVTDTICQARLPRVKVVLTRLDRTRIRTTRTLSDGSFSVGAIEAGVPHVIVVEDLDEHDSREQPVAPLIAGQVGNLPVGVERVRDKCD